MYKKTVLPNGIRVITEEIEYVNSVAIGLWIKTGSINENPSLNGITHFIEHLLFKGTDKRDAIDIVKGIESVGGVINAFTGKEFTCIYAKVLDRYFQVALDTMADILLNSRFDAEEIDKEREIVLQEIILVEETPDDYIHDLFNYSLFYNHPLGYPVQGTINSVKEIKREDILNYFNQFHIPDRIIISSVGKVDHENVVQMADKYFGSLTPKKISYCYNKQTPPSRINICKRDLEQVYFCLGTRLFPLTYYNRYESSLLNIILGGGMSSRLFQEVREKNGLAYSIYSYVNSYHNIGSFVIFGVTSEKNMREVMKIITKEISDLKKKPVSEEELESAKDQLKGNFLLSMEIMDNRMNRLAHNEIYFRRYFTPEEILENIDKISSEDLRRFTSNIFRKNFITFVLLGNMNGKNFHETLMNI
jgi:predicted Zn-dependent peptidase